MPMKNIKQIALEYDCFVTWNNDVGIIDYWPSSSFKQRFPKHNNFDDVKITRYITHINEWQSISSGEDVEKLFNKYNIPINESIIGRKGNYYMTIRNHDIIRIVRISDNKEIGLYRVLMDDRELDLLGDWWGVITALDNPTFCNNMQILCMTFDPESLEIGRKYKIIEIYRCAGEEDVYYHPIAVLNMQRSENVLQKSITNRHYKLIWKER